MVPITKMLLNMLDFAQNLKKDSRVLLHAYFGHHVNELWIFKVLKMGIPKPTFGSSIHKVNILGKNL